VKASRDVTIHSKKVIFAVHRLIIDLSMKFHLIQLWTLLCCFTCRNANVSSMVDKSENIHC
jgi:hypothetical protein